MAFTGMDYMNANPDVWKAYQDRDTTKSVPLDQFARSHYDQYGKAEGRNWGQGATGADANAYLKANPDVANDPYWGNNPRAHYGRHGKSEGREWPSVTSGGAGGGGSSSPMPMPRNDLLDIFQPDKYPKSRSGLPEEYQMQILEKLIPKLLESVEGYEGNIDKSTQAAQELFESQSRRGMKGQLQGILNSLAGRNILDSSVASDTIAKGMGDIVQSGAQKGYESQMNNAALKAQLPAMLANIAQLGQSSTSENQLEPYKLLAQYDWNLM